VLTNFYKDEESGTAKEILFKAISTAVQHVDYDIDLPDLPKRQGPNKSKHRCVSQIYAASASLSSALLVIFCRLFFPCVTWFVGQISFLGQQY